jgi:hypothetical protein
MPVSRLIRSWSDLDPEFRERIAPVFCSDCESAADRWQTEFVKNPSNAAGFVLVYAAMTQAGLWNTVARVISTWAVGMFFVPSDATSELLNQNPDFVAHNSGGFRHRLAHHSYWEKSWIQTTTQNAAIHIGINRKFEKGKRKAEVHLDVFNGFHNRFNGVLSAKHVLYEVLMKRGYSVDDFESMLVGAGVVIPPFTY